MQYMGGKTRIAKQIAAEIDKVRKPGQLVWDAFCGGLSVSVTLSKNGPVLASDACLPLISLYKAVQDGWDPPTEVSKETYDKAINLFDTDPMKAFCGFGCSFGGKWFGGYATDKNGTRNRDGKPSNYALSARKSLIKTKVTAIFKCIDFLETIPEPTNSIIYCDPPYADTTGYDGSDTFDYCKFVRKVEQWSEFTDIFVSEYDFRLGEVVFEKEQITTVSRNKSKYKSATEKLFHIKKNSLFI